MIATAMPSRNRSPRWPSARWRSISAASARGLGEDAILDFGRQVLVGKIDRRFEMGEDAGQPLRPAAIEVAQLAIELAQGLAALRLGLGRGEIGDRLGLGQVELAVQKGAAGEFAGLGEAQPEPGQRRMTAASTARLPCRWNSATSSPVALLGAGNHSTSPSSSGSPRLGIDEPAAPGRPRRRQAARQPR